jgi:16S rRNA processing protein RimM
VPPRPSRRSPARPPAPEARDGFVAVGHVRGPRGLRGELKVDPLTDFPQRFAPGNTVYAAGAPYEVRHAREHQGVLLLELSGITTRKQADGLRDALLEVPEGELAPLEADRYYRHQIVGMEAVDTEGRALGRVEQVLDTGANDVYLIRSEEGELLVPATDEVVKDVDVAAGRMTVALLEGLEQKPAKRPAAKRPVRRRGARRS